MIRVKQIKAARVLLDISQTQLADLADVGVATVKRIEAARDEITGNANTLWKIQSALESAGVSFIDADEDAGPGVRLKAQPKE